MEEKQIIISIKRGNHRILVTCREVMIKEMTIEKDQIMATVPKVIKTDNNNNKLMSLILRLNIIFVEVKLQIRIQISLEVKYKRDMLNR